MTRLIRPYNFILDSASGWRTQDATATSAEDGSLRLNPLAQRRPALTDPHGTFGGVTLPRGVAIWGDEIFIADPTRHRILHWQPCCGPATLLATIGGLGDGPRQLDTPLGLAISHRDDLVVVDSGNRRLLQFTLPGLALRRILGPFPSRLPGTPYSADPTWHPVDVSCGPQGRLFVADQEGFVWRLDTQGRPDSRFDGTLPAGFVPLRVLVDCKGRTYVVGQDPPVILIMDTFGKVMPGPEQLVVAVHNWLPVHIPALAKPDPRPPTFDEETIARLSVLPAELSQLMDVDLKHYLDQAMKHYLDQAKREQKEPKTQDEVWQLVRTEAYESILPGAYARYLPQFLTQDLGRSRLSLSGDQVLLSPADPRDCERQPQPTDLHVDESGLLKLDDLTNGPYLQYVPPVATFSSAGLFRMQPLDSGRLGNPWHRLSLEMTVPERTGIRVFTFTSDVLRPDLVTDGLLAEPPQTGPWQTSPDNTDEFLIQSPPGRYLYLALALKGPGDRTPSVERIYVYAHRHSSLHFLPAVYQTDETSRLVLDRLLSLTDTLFGEIESQIEDFGLFLDVAGAPADFLPWLASWFDLALEQVWSDAQQRAFLKNIVELYRWRGTIRGLRLLLQLHANLKEPMPQIVEHYRGIGEAVLETWLGQPPEGDTPHHFSVLLPAQTINTEEKRVIIMRLIDNNKPAHTHFSIRPVVPGLRLGSTTVRGTALGLDSLLGSHSSWRLPAQSPGSSSAGQVGGAAQDSVLASSTALPPAPAPRAVAVRLGFTRLGEPQLGCRTCHPCPPWEESIRRT